MKVEKVKDYNRAFTSLQVFASLCLFGLIGTNIFYYINYQQLHREKDSKVWVVTDNGTFAAYAQEEQSIDIYEAQYMSKIFIKSMFAHDAETYDSHVDDALHLVDDPTGKMLVEQFDKGKVQQNYVRWGSRTEVAIDSIKILNNGMPLQVVAYFHQKHYIGSEFKDALPIALHYDVVRNFRHDQNPFGMQISKLDFIAYKQDSNG